MIKDRFPCTTKGYEEAKEWLIAIGEWERVSTSGFSTDGWSVVAEANAIWNNSIGKPSEVKLAVAKDLFNGKPLIGFQHTCPNRATICTDGKKSCRVWQGSNSLSLKINAWKNNLKSTLNEN